MFPILYEDITVGTVPQHFGLGVLSDCISCYVEPVRNDKYDLVMEYPADGIHAKELAKRRIIKAKPNFTDDPQLFRINRIGKTMKGVFSVYARHISYDLSGYEIVSGSANNAVSACNLLESAAPGWTIDTTKEVSANFVITEPSSVRSWFAGKQGSFLDVFGTAEIKYDNFHVRFMLHAGEDRGVEIRYAKNLLELSQELDFDNLYTHVRCYSKNEETVVTGDRVSTGLTLDVPKVLTLDVSSDFEGVPTVQDLNNKASEYISSHNLTTPSDNITLDFAQSGELTNRVDLCDTVTVYYEALGISGKMKCIRTKWDVLREKYIETEFGDVKKSLADTMTENTGAIENAVNTAETAANAVAGKKRVFIDTPIPPYDVGDLWTNSDNLYVCVTARVAGEEYNTEEDWSLATSYTDRNALEDAVAEATIKITGNSGGYVMLHDSDGDGNPDEILIVNNPDLQQATQVWRWNRQGLGFSTSYASDNYAYAFTNNGMIVADRILTGNLDAARVTIQHLTAKMFEGQEIALGGTENGDGTFIIRNAQNVEIGRMDIDGLKFFGAGAVGSRPYVKLDINGLAGFDANGNEIFWVTQDEFHMKKCVAENEIQACGKFKYVPVTIRDGNGNIVNDGVACVPIAEASNGNI